MYPPTPTPLAAAPASPLVFDAGLWRIWAFADDAIMIWQQMQRHNMGTVIQIAVILVIIIFFVWYVVNQTRNLTQENDL